VAELGVYLKYLDILVIVIANSFRHMLQLVVFLKTQLLIMYKVLNKLS